MAKTKTKPQSKKPLRAKSDGPSVTLVITGKVREISIKQGMTVRQALTSENAMPGKGSQVRVNNQVCTNLDMVLKANDQVMVIGETSGG